MKKKNWRIDVRSFRFSWRIQFGIRIVLIALVMSKPAKGQFSTTVPNKTQPGVAAGTIIPGNQYAGFTVPPTVSISAPSPVSSASIGRYPELNGDPLSNAALRARELQEGNGTASSIEAIRRAGPTPTVVDVISLSRSAETFLNDGNLASAVAFAVKARESYNQFAGMLTVVQDYMAKAEAGQRTSDSFLLNPKISEAINKLNASLSLTELKTFQVVLPPVRYLAPSTYSDLIISTNRNVVERAEGNIAESLADLNRLKQRLDAIETSVGDIVQVTDGYFDVAEKMRDYFEEMTKIPVANTLVRPELYWLELEELIPRIGSTHSKAQALLIAVKDLNDKVIIRISNLESNLKMTRDYNNKRLGIPGS